MTPHRRRCYIKAILEVKGALAIGKDGASITAEELLKMPPAELLKLYEELTHALDGANITEPHGRSIETMKTIVMEAVDPDSDLDD